MGNARWAYMAIALFAACSDEDSQGKSDTTVVPTVREQCQPCRADPGCPDGARCLDYLGAGAFCGDECSDTLPCPSGFLCTTVDTLAGQTVTACVHDSGMCPCTPEVAAKAEPTVCVTPSDWGSCRGESICDGSAWSPCDGPIAAPDLPNGLDDDCDGQTDENVCNCGDQVCNGVCGEDVTTCPCDCAVKGDGICSPCGEGPLTAPEDCCRSTSGSSSCGDHVCMGYGCGETPATCAPDCGNACGNLICEQGETPYTCREDCLHKVCGNHICESTDGGPEQCPQDCAPFCGNCICEPDRDESQFNCPIDCGYCGDRECSRCAVLKENAESCPEDCCEAGATCLVAGSCNIGRYACENDDTCELTAELWPRGVECGPKTCDGDALRLESRCDDEGQCQPGVLFPCQGYVCRNDACLTSCSGAGDCATGFECIGTVCSALTDTPPCECEAEGTTCGRTGACDENGACIVGDAGEPCGEGASCVDGMLAPSFTCDGEGHCVGEQATFCPGHLACAGPDDCLEACADNADCAPTYVCTPSHTCIEGVDEGDPCEGDSQCQSGNCEQGVCCETACTGLCRTCAGATPGVCSFVAAGDDPGEQCQSSGDPCGTTGACDGAGHCKLGANGTSCGGGVCNDDVNTPVWKCDGAGDCVEATSQACPNHLACRPDNSGCLDACDEDSECAFGYICNKDARTCGQPLDDGDDCQSDAQCANGHCEGGVCCGDVCETECMSCRVAGHVGTCWMVPSGFDPENDCEPIAGELCGPTGVCDGAGACADASSTVICASPGCFEGQIASAFHCDGDGSCAGEAPVPCPNHLECMNATMCLSFCTRDDDCRDGWVCNETTMQCADPGRTGSPCDRNDDCVSNHCDDNVCCEAGCTDVCERCALDGSCQQIDREQVPGCMTDRSCVQGQCTSLLLPDGSPCGSDTQCQSNACSDGFCCNTNCDGVVCADCGLFGHEGTCTTVFGDEETDCTNSFIVTPCVGNCTRWCNDNGVCEMHSTGDSGKLCGFDEDCQATQWCPTGGGQCQADFIMGSPCGRNEQCLSNICFSFVCQ